MSTVENSRANDEELLVRFEQVRDQSAFAELVRRHGPMVMTTVFRILANNADADDAFQATFLALAKAASKIRDKSSLGPWLHRTARNCSCQIHRAKEARRKLEISLQERAAKMSDAQSIPQNNRLDDEELIRTLDEEIDRLPDKLRIPLVMCDLEGAAQKDVAAVLQVPASTVRSHLVKARRLLRERLVQRGVKITLAGLGAFLAASSETPAFAGQLAAQTSNNAVLFAAGKTAAEIGLSDCVLHVASRVALSMSAGKTASILLAVALVLASVAVPLNALDLWPPKHEATKTLHYWRFEPGAGFLKDSVGSANLSAENVFPASLPSSGRGSRFANAIRNAGSASAADSLRPISGLTTSASTPIDGSFTIELLVHFDRLRPTSQNQRSVVVSQASDPVTQNRFSWALAVERTGDIFPQMHRVGGQRPRLRELELFLSTGTQFVQILSRIRIKANTDYYLCAMFDTDGTATFYAKNLETGAISKSQIDHEVDQIHPDGFLQIAGPYEFSFVDGLIDEVRFSRGVLQPEQLLVEVVENEAL